MHVFETPGDVSLQIRLPRGRVLVTTVDEPRTTVDVVATGRSGSDVVDSIEVSAEPYRDGHVVRVEHRDQIRLGPIKISWGQDVEVRIACPPGSDLAFASEAADIRVDGDLGEVDVNTPAGDVTLGDVSKKLLVKTASGDIVAGALANGGQILTVSGDVRLDSHDSDLAVRSVSGDVRIGSLRGRLQLSTTSGDIALDSVEAGEVRAQTVSGDARIGVGRGTRVYVDAASVSGDLSSELGLEDEEPADEPESEVVPLHVKTVSGDVQIVRAAEAFSS
jgi:hypothetical protein